MSKTPRSGAGDEVREMRPEYRCDSGKARPNPYAARLGKDTVTVVLDPDVAAVFTSSHAVNEFLRAVIAVLPASVKRRSRRPAG